MTHLTRRGFISAATATATLAAPALGAASAQASSQTAALPTRNPLIHRFWVGGIEVIALSDGYAPLPNVMIEGFEAEAAKNAAQLAYKPFSPETFTAAINGYVLRTAGRTIAVDTGAPAAMAPTVGQWHTALAQAGISPAEIDTVFLTHAHGDHVDGLADLNTGAQEALLPNAELVLAEAEWAFTFSDEVLAQLPDQFQQNFMASRALLTPYADKRVELDMSREQDIAPGITAVPLPGHTPGHMGLRLSDGNQTLLIWGDTVHAQAYQFAHPEWSIFFDADAAEGQKTRARLLDMAATDRLAVAGMHLDFPSLGYVERTGEAYRYVPVSGDIV